MLNPAPGIIKRKVNILRPAFAVDMTTIRDRILTSYVPLYQNVACFIQPKSSMRLGQAQLGGIAINDYIMMFATDTDVQVNDVLQENANIRNKYQITYYDVTGVLDNSDYGFLVTVDCTLKNYQRGQ